MDESATEQIPAKVKDEFKRNRMFDQEESLRLIECVRKRPKLWHRQYLRSRASGIADWEDIQCKEFSSYSVDQLRVRWKTLRDCYRREAKRIEDGNVQGNPWPLYKHMGFLHGHFRLKKSIQRRNGGTARDRKNRLSLPLKIEPDVVADVPLNPNEANNECMKVNEGSAFERSDEICLNRKEQADASYGECSEVTYKNKFRSRIQSASSMDNNEGGSSAWNRDAENPNCAFLMSLTPFLNALPAHENLKVRIKMLQLVASAKKRSVGSTKQQKD